MPRGRKPKPTALKIVEGNPGKRRLPKGEPNPQGGLSEPPDWFTDLQGEYWTHAIGNAPAGLLKQLDRETLVTWCVAAALHREAAESLKGASMFVRAPSGYPMQHPALAVLNKQANLMLKAAEHLGFTPVARVRLATPADNSDDDIEARYFA